jgi:hypothetical protein
MCKKIWGAYRNGKQETEPSIVPRSAEAKKARDHNDNHDETNQPDYTVRVKLLNKDVHASR